jgi:ribose transport system ATP-binding protein
MESLVDMIRITKRFGDVQALSEVDFQLESGEVHVLFGENGAGKSTLMSILSGVHQPTSGVLKLDGQPILLRSVREAAALGICTVFQELSLVPTLTVFENIYLGRELKRGPLMARRVMRSNVQRLLQELGFSIDVDRRVADMSRGEQQMVEIAKAFLAKARVLILDEPTASLTEEEARKLFVVVNKAKSSGVAIVYISHRIKDFMAIADRISILRDGEIIQTVRAEDTSETALIEMMTGRPVDKIYPKIRRAENRPVLMSLRNVATAGVAGASIDVRAGEVLGVAGLVGSGKSRVWRAALGLQPLTSGQVHLGAQNLTNRPTREILAKGVFYLPPDRKGEGLQLAATARDNISLALLRRKDVSEFAGFLSPSRLHRQANAIGRRVDIAARHMDRAVIKLSGGNQQKVLFGKGFGDEHDIYIFDEPTVGVDMRTRCTLYDLIKSVAESGKAVVLISSDLSEAIQLSHRLLVFAGGRISAELTGEDINEESVLKNFFSDARMPA